ncbi:TniQ family protein [Marinobacter sp.]|uniref:TniQ family protein n=1 Tax=Marinobacter sp. TaxID=50741 RepID=UPI003BA97ABE
MVSFFPRILPDEHLFSVFARYHHLAGNCTSAHTKAQLGLALGPLKPQDTANLTFHMALKTAATLLDLPLSKVARSNTLTPLLRLSLPAKLQDQQLTEWAISQSSVPDSKILMNDRMLTFDKSWRFCNECVEEDVRKVGVCYWHLSHQIPSVSHCKIHQLPLLSSGLKTLSDFQLPRATQNSISPEGPNLKNKAWESWLIDLFARCQASETMTSLASLEATLESIWRVPRSPRSARLQRYQEILGYVEDVAGIPLLGTIFEFYQGDRLTYRGRARPNFIRTTFESTDPKIRHPIYYLLPIWAAGLSPHPAEWSREL